MEIETVSIIGLGALGILYGHHLTKHLPKENVRIVADQNRIDRYIREGVYCNGEQCDFHYVTPEETIEPADLLLFTVKSTGLEDSLQSVRHHVGKNTIMMSALNGISSEGIIRKVYGDENLLYTVAQGMDAVKEGNELTYENMGLLCFGEKEPGIVSENMKKIERFFKKVEIPHEVDTDMVKRQWGKFMTNVGVNQTVAVFESDYGEIQKEGKARDMMIAAMREVIALSEKEGVMLTEDDLSYWLSVLDTLSPGGKPSMAQDLEARRYSEVDLFSGTVLELAKKHNIDTPVNEEFYNKITEIEKTYE